MATLTSRQPSMYGRMPRARELFEGTKPGEKGELLPAQVDLLRAVQEHRQRVREGRRTGTWRESDEAMAQWEIVQAFYLRQEQARGEIDAELGKIEQKWAAGRDPARELANLTRWRMRYGSMDKRAVDQAAEEYAAAPAGRDPDEVDALLEAAVRVRADGTAALRDIMRKVDYQRPWRSTPEAAPLLRLRELYSAPLGEVRVASDLGTETVPIADLFDDAEVR